MATRFIVFQQLPLLNKAIEMAVCGEGENLLAENSKLEWQWMLHKALIEQDPEKLKERVAEAEAAIFLRLQDLAQTHDGSAEQVALRDASEALLALKTHGLHFPNWKV